MKPILMMIATLIVASGTIACNRKACERACECQSERQESDTESEIDWGDDYLKECIKECVKERDNASGACNRAYRKYARCLEDNDCDFTVCQSEFDTVENEC
jgi:hypothetical protein